MNGAHIICSMLRQGFSVRAARTPGDNTEYTKYILSLYSHDYEKLYSEIDWVDVSYDDPDSLDMAMDGICATICCIDPKLTKSKSMEDNVQTVRNIIDAIKDSECEYLCYLSSVYALGDEPDGNEITEKSQRNPKGNYSKLSNTYYNCEMEVWRAMQEGVKAGILNLAPVLGPGDWENDRSKFLNDKLAQVYYTEGVTGLVSINDVVKCVMTMVRQKISGENFIVSGQNECYRDFQRLLAKNLDQKEASRKAGWLRMLIWKIQYGIKSLLSDRRPYIDDIFFDEITKFNVYSNEKSINRLISHYEDIDETVKYLCNIFKKRIASAN